MFLGAFSLGLSAQTLVSGGIYSNATWTLANSPYIVTGNVVVFPGVTLTIQPGVEVRVKKNPVTTPGYSGSGGFSIEARGIINAVGTPSAKIKFKSDTTIAGELDLWRGFIEKRSQNGKVNLDYVDFSNAFSVIGFDANPTGMVFHNCKFENNALAFVDNFPSLKFFDCEFKGNINAFQGLCQNFVFKRTIFDGNQSVMSVYPNSFTIDSCSFINNGGGINLPYSCNLNVSNSIFKNNYSGLTFVSGSSIKKCKFYGNQLAIGGSSCLIDSCTFDSNVVAINAGENLKIFKCIITNNQKGVVIFNFSNIIYAPSILNNKLCNNSLYNIENGSDKNLNIPSNCFCETDSTIIESKIYDGYDDVTRGLISYNIFDSACFLVLKTVNKLGAVSGIQSSQLSTFRIYPNPTSAFVNIDNADNSTSIEFFSITGASQFKLELINGINKIDLTMLPKGIYYAKVNNEKNQ
jgi:Secretion system C-terminal sorting domain